MDDFEQNIVWNVFIITAIVGIIVVGGRIVVVQFLGVCCYNCYWSTSKCKQNLTKYYLDYTSVLNT